MIININEKKKEYENSFTELITVAQNRKKVHRKNLTTLLTLNHTLFIITAVILFFTTPVPTITLTLLTFFTLIFTTTVLTKTHYIDAVKNDPQVKKALHKTITAKKQYNKMYRTVKQVRQTRELITSR
jgi:flagellar biosynthesis component FlhA